MVAASFVGDASSSSTVFVTLTALAPYPVDSDASFSPGVAFVEAERPAGFDFAVIACKTSGSARRSTRCVSVVGALNVALSKENKTKVVSKRT